MKPVLEPTTTTRSVLQRIADGDETAVDDCLHVYGGLVWSLAKRSMRCPSDAEDAVQEIFVEVWQSAARYEPDRGSETTFVATIARRKLIDRMRRRPEPAEALATMEDSTDTAHATPPPDLQVEVEDEARKARHCLQKFAERQREALRLSIQQSLPHRVIAQRLNLPLGTVKSLVRRGLLQLRECMDRPAVSGEGSAL